MTRITPKRKAALADIVTIAAFFLILCGGLMAHLLAGDQERSDTERRVLEQFPQVSAKTIWNGTFFDDLETYGADQFPARDGFLELKAAGTIWGLGERDTEGYYMAQGQLSRLDDPPEESSVLRVAELYQMLAEQYGKEGRVYYTVIPSKNRYLAAQNGYPSWDYDRIEQLLREHTEGIQEIRISGLLEAEDYYQTDLHWRQEELLDVADALLSGMSNPTGSGGWDTYTKTYGGAFLGAYARQSFLDVQADALYYLESPVTKGASVYDWEEGVTTAVYEKAALDGADQYDIFLSGAKALLTVENPLAEEERELILFRDSFGSSLAPLLLHGYSKITLVDLRYISRTALEQYLEPSQNCDILFAYNDSVLGSSAMIDRP